MCTEQKQADVVKLQKMFHGPSHTGQTTYSNGLKEPHKRQMSRELGGKAVSLLELLCCTACRLPKRGHNAAVCRSGRMDAIQEQEVETVFLGKVSKGHKSKKQEEKHCK